MHTGQRKSLQLPENEQYDSLSHHLISGKLFQDRNKLDYINFAINFAEDYQPRLNTKIDNSVNHVFKTMTVADLKTLHTIWERKCLLAMSGKNLQLDGFLLKTS